MADALLGATVNIALENLLSFTQGQIVMVKEFEKDVESLRETVELISAVLADAEKKQVNQQGVNLWLKKLEALACRAEHVFDEVNYEMLRHRVEGKVSSFFSSHNNIVFRLRMAHKLKGIKIEFELINEKATALGLQSQLGAVVANASVPLSDTTQSEKVSIVSQKVIGRGKDEETIVHKLLSQCNELLTSIPIVGIGGLGKTTLAQSVYNNKQVVEYFGERIWVSVPKGYAPMNIFKLILQFLSKDSNGTLNTDNIQLDVVVQKIKGKLKEKRYLLVLDNVWSGHPELEWGEFLGSLCGISTGFGNCIIVTTREGSVASIFCAERDGYCHHLGKLSDEDCLDIVKEKARIHEESIQFFEAINESIIKICHGVPLVARVIGGLLRRNPSRDWHSLVQKGISNLTGDEHNDIKQILQLSFDHLHSPSVKKCFTYCSLFQKGSIIEKKELIQFWMAEGFLQPKAGHDDMEIGNECINSLLGSSLLQEVMNKRGECYAVEMHDLVHDLAQSISNPMKDLKDVKDDIHRYLVIESFGEETKTLPEMRMLRTLFVGSGTPKSMLLMSFKHLHVLKLYDVGGHEFSSSIGKLLHLRYLGFSSSDMKAFPESISKLYNLQTLRIEDCEYLNALPKGMTKLVNLRHLHCDSDISLPPKIGCLTNLQSLEYFRVSENNQIKELGCLSNLRGNLTICNLERVSNKEEAQLAGLNMKPMNSLSFQWSSDDRDQEVLESDEEVLEGLQPNPNLQELEIFSFSGNEFPSWLKNMGSLSQRFNRLVSLSIKFCQRCKQLPILGQLPSLKYLKLYSLDDMSRIEPSFFGIDDHDYNGSENIIKSGQRTRKIFPALIDLKVKWMENLEEWMEYQASDNEYVEIFPNLERLLIKDCPKLRVAPIHYFSSVKHLEIDGTDLDIFEDIAKYQNFNRSPSNAEKPQVQKGIFTSLETLRIRDCPNLSELPEYLYEFQSLQELEIISCPNLKSFPTPMGSQRLTSLQILGIINCNGLSNLPADLLKSCGSSLQLLHINNLSNLESFPFDLQQTPSLSSLRLWNLPKLMTMSKLEHLIPCSSRLSYLTIGGFSDSVEFDWSQLTWLSSSLRELRLRRWPNLVSLPNQLQHLTALKELLLFKLEKIEALPDWFANFVSLEELWLEDCEKLSYLPSMAAMRSLTKLTHLKIEQCPLLKERCIQRNNPGSEWSKISHIPDILIDHCWMESGSESSIAEDADQIYLNCKWLACLPSKTTRE